MKTIALSALAIAMLLNSCAPYPYYGYNGYDGGYQSNGSEWIVPIAAAAIITGVALSDHHHGHYYRGGYGHGGYGHGWGRGYSRY